MTTPNQQLLSGMSPDAARLLDRQMKDQQTRQLANTPNAYGGIAAGTQGMFNLLARAGGKERAGVNEVQALQAQKKVKDEEAKMKALQDKLSNAPEEKLMSLYQNNAVSNPKLAQAVMSVLNMRKETSGVGSVRENIKSIQLLMNGKQVTAESAMKAIQAERKEAGSGLALLEYTSKAAEEEADNELRAKTEAEYFKIEDQITTLRNQNSRSNSLIASIGRIDKSSGVPAQVNSIFKRITGTEDSESVLNTMIESLRMEQAIGNLPAGVASDRDIQLVLNGTLPSTANPEALVEWLEALQRLNDTAMAEKQGVLEWLDKEGTIKGYATHRRERHRKLREEFLAKEKIRLEKEEADAQARIAKKRELARKRHFPTL